MKPKPRWPPFGSRWPNTKAIKIGWLAGRGNQSPDIAKILNDGTSAETIRTQIQRAGLELIGRNRSAVYVPVKLSVYERGVLGRLAAARNLTLEEWMRQVVVNAGMPEDLFNAIVLEKE